MRLSREFTWSSLLSSCTGIEEKACAVEDPKEEGTLEVGLGGGVGFRVKGIREKVIGSGIGMVCAQVRKKFTK